MNQPQERLGGFMGMKWVALAAALAAGSAAGQDLPSAPQRRLDLGIKAFDVTARALDVVSTQQFLARGGHEWELPQVVVNHPANMALFEAGVLMAETYGARQLAKHGHTRMARLVPLIDGAAVLGQDVSNFRIQRKPGVQVCSGCSFARTVGRSK